MARKPKAGSTPAAPPPPVGTKIDQLVALLARPEGATIEQMMMLTGWQQHTVRGCLVGTLKSKRKLTITSQKVDKVRTYRIAAAPEGRS